MCLGADEMAELEAKCEQIRKQHGENCWRHCTEHCGHDQIPAEMTRSVWYQYGDSKPASTEEEAFTNWFKDTCEVKSRKRVDGNADVG